MYSDAYLAQTDGALLAVVAAEYFRQKLRRKYDRAYSDAPGPTMQRPPAVRLSLERNKESILERNKESIKVVINGLI
ncbi:hypothetical protein [Blautia sp. LMAG:89]|uniref:hypothetical protein n=1 Tax=Blautia sp. LMAG:89 TaxID=1969173 RepID=UPI00257CFAA2|nr:hypothetical protein [Blautia sp. LMAG:89]